MFNVYIYVYHIKLSTSLQHGMLLFYNARYHLNKYRTTILYVFKLVINNGTTLHYPHLQSDVSSGYLYRFYAVPGIQRNSNLNGNLDSESLIYSSIIVTLKMNLGNSLRDPLARYDEY